MDSKKNGLFIRYPSICMECIIINPNCNDCKIFKKWLKEDKDENKMNCSYCNKKFNEEDHLIIVDEENIAVHYDCYDDWLRDRFFSCEAVFRKRKIVYI